MGGAVLPMGPQVPLASIPVPYQGYLPIIHVKEIRGFTFMKAKEIWGGYRGSRANLDVQPVWCPVIMTCYWCVFFWHYSERLACILSLDVPTGCDRISVNSHFTDGEIETQPSKTTEGVTLSIRDGPGIEIVPKGPYAIFRVSDKFCRIRCSFFLVWSLLHARQVFCPKVISLNLILFCLR